MKNGGQVDSFNAAQSNEYSQSLGAGIVGAFLVATGSILLCLWRVLKHPTVPNHGCYIVLIAVAAILMALIEIFVTHSYRFQFDFTQRRNMTPEKRTDVMRKFCALLISLTLAWGCYGLFGEYALQLTNGFMLNCEKSWYAPFFDFFKIATIALLVLAIPYYYLCAIFGKWEHDDDEFLCLWNGYTGLIKFRAPERKFWGSVRSMLIKFFFVPVMTVFFLKNATVFEDRFIQFLAGPWVWNTVFANKLYFALYEGMYLIDVNLALLGYICCFRILDTHIRSAEPTLLGWVVALACYPPFNSRVTGLYISHDPNIQTWDKVFSGVAWIYYPMGIIILSLLFIYLSATIAFGLRFSNLTHRGIIWRGPYRLVRHPAYVAKNISWWLIGLPFLHSFGDCLRLLMLNGIYILRALTEERHLNRDPAYQQYMKKVRWRFIPGIY